MWRDMTVQGGVNLGGAHVGILADDPASWGVPEAPPRWTWWRWRRWWRASPTGGRPFILAGFTYDQLVSALTAEELLSARSAEEPVWGWRRRVGWLGREESGGLQPWVQLAGVLRRAGRESEAGRVLYYGHRRAARGWRRILGLVGYGYRPWIALLWAALVVAVTAGWLQLASDAIVPTRTTAEIAADAARESRGGPAAPDTEDPVSPAQARALCEQPAALYPCPNPVVFAVEVVVPLVQLDQRQHWQLDPERAPPLGWWLRCASLFGWFIGILAAASLTPALRKE